MNQSHAFPIIICCLFVLSSHAVMSVSGLSCTTPNGHRLSGGIIDFQLVEPNPCACNTTCMTSVNGCVAWNHAISGVDAGQCIGFKSYPTSNIVDADYTTSNPIYDIACEFTSGQLLSGGIQSFTSMENSGCACNRACQSHNQVQQCIQWNFNTSDGTCTGFSSVATVNTTDIEFFSSPHILQCPHPATSIPYVLAGESMFNYTNVMDACSCMAVCKSTLSCTYWSYGRTGGRCMLFDSSFVTAAYNDSSNEWTSSYWSDSPCHTVSAKRFLPVSAPAYTYNHVDSSCTCNQVCIWAKDCDFWTYDAVGSDAQRCQGYRNGEVASVAVDNKAISSLYIPNCPNNTLWFYIFTGTEMEAWTEIPSACTCLALCKATVGCAYFSFSPDHVCYLYQSAGAINSAIENKAWISSFWQPNPVCVTPTVSGQKLDSISFLFEEIYVATACACNHACVWYGARSGASLASPTQACVAWNYAVTGPLAGTCTGFGAGDTSGIPSADANYVSSIYAAADSCSPLASNKDTQLTGTSIIVIPDVPTSCECASMCRSRAGCDTWSFGGFGSDAASLHSCHLFAWSQVTTISTSATGWISSWAATNCTAVTTGTRFTGTASNQFSIAYINSQCACNRACINHAASSATTKCVGWDYEFATQICTGYSAAELDAVGVIQSSDVNFDSSIWSSSCQGNSNSNYILANSHLFGKATTIDREVASACQCNTTCAYPCAWSYDASMTTCYTFADGNVAGVSNTISPIWFSSTYYNITSDPSFQLSSSSSSSSTAGDATGTVTSSTASPSSTGDAGSTSASSTAGDASTTATSSTSITSATGTGTSTATGTATGTGTGTGTGTNTGAGTVVETGETSVPAATGSSTLAPVSPTASSSGGGGGGGVTSPPVTPTGTSPTSGGTGAGSTGADESSAGTTASDSSSSGATGVSASGSAAEGAACATSAECASDACDTTTNKCIASSVSTSVIPFGLSYGAVAGIGAGVVVLFILLIICCYWCYRRNSSAKGLDKWNKNLVNMSSSERVDNPNVNTGTSIGMINPNHPSDQISLQPLRHQKSDEVTLPIGVDVASISDSGFAESDETKPAQIDIEVQ